MRRFFGAILVPFSILGAVLPVSASEIFIEPRELSILPQRTFEVSIFLDTQQEDINALEGKLIFPTDLLELKEIRDGNSLVTFWIDRPQSTQAPVPFAGMIPGGYRFPKGLLLSLVFESKQEGQGVVAIEQARVLKNDGLGTPAPLTLSPFRVTISSQAAESPAMQKSTDTDPPEPFTPVLSREEHSFDGQWFVSFATQDKGSGVDHFEIQTASWWGRWKWKRADSPYVLGDGSPRGSIFVKAVDKAGNERIERVAFESAKSTPYTIFLALGILLLGVIVILIRMRRALFRSILKRGSKTGKGLSE